MNNDTIGWIGLGNMGIPMCKNLLNAGYKLYVYNRTAAKEQELNRQGAQAATSPASLMHQCNIVFLMVSDDQATRDLITGKDGLLSSNSRDCIIINMSTVSPSVSMKMAEACKPYNHHYIDAPVSGSVKQAEEGQLVIMAGGDKPSFEKVKLLLEILGKLVLHLGDTGSGNTAKLAINTLLAIQAQGLAEAVLLAEKNGIETGQLMELINNSAIGNVFLKIKGNAITSKQYKAAFALKHIAKDLRLAKDIGLDTPLGKVAHDSFQQASVKTGEEDIIAIIKSLS